MPYSLFYFFSGALKYGMSRYQRDAITVEEEFILDYLTINNGTVLYKPDLTDRDNQNIVPAFLSADRSMNYIRFCNIYNYIDKQTGLCQPCPQGRASTQWNSTYCASAGTMWKDHCSKTDPTDLDDYYCRVSYQVSPNPEA